MFKNLTKEKMLPHTNVSCFFFFFLFIVAQFFFYFPGSQFILLIHSMWVESDGEKKRRSYSSDQQEVTISNIHVYTCNKCN